MRATQFAVQGAGEFPLDMLRYDECYPVSPADVNAIAGEKRRTVLLYTYAKHMPTIDRWDSFNWLVVQINGERVGA